MGDRYTITAAKEQLAERFAIDVPERYKPRYNAAPTQVLPIIMAGSTGLSFFYWGQLPDRAKNRPIGSKLLYTAVSSITEKPAALQSLLERRCLIPADGFYAWKRISKKGRVAHRFVFDQEETIAFGGIWEEFEDDQGEIMHTFKILMQSDQTASMLTPQIPFVVDKMYEKAWMDTQSTVETLKEILEHSNPGNMTSYSVSPKIEDPGNDNATLIQPFAPTDQFGNYSLFD